jgi:hypothetical protein
MSAYQLTDSQKTALDAVTSELGPSTAEVAFQYLIREYPDDFDNTGDDMSLVRMNYVSPEPTAPASEQEKSKE